MVLGRQFTADTEALLKQRGLRCVCELCDCGRYHRHKGCTLDSHKMASVFKRPGLADAQTDYQATFMAKDCNPRHSKRPLPRLRNPHPPPMDFRTENRTEYVKPNEPGLQPSCKFLDEYKPPDVRFDGATTYNQSFTDRGPPTLAKIYRPKTVTTKPGPKFQSATTHNQAFTPKVPIPQATYGEIPSFTGSILFPDKKGKFSAKTCNQDVYQGKFVPRADTLKPRDAQIKIGVEGEHDLRTEHKEAFKTPAIADRQRASPRTSNMIKNQKRAKFQSETQSRSDFPGYGGKMPLPPKPIPPPPAKLNLAMSSERAFETTNDFVYKVNWDPKKLERTKLLKPDNKPYTPPKVKFAVTTQSKEDFKEREAPQMVKIRPPSRIEPSKAKFAGDTAYSTQFKHHKNVPYVRYGDFHESGIYLKPVVKFFQDGSVTTQDFSGAVGGRPRTTFRPVQEIERTEGNMADATMYRDAFGRKNLPECSYLKWVSEHQAKKAATRLTNLEPGTVVVT